MKRPRRKDASHLDFIRSLQCILCGDNTSVEAAHIRQPARWAGKRQTGKGERPDDRWAVPLCSGHHQIQHTGSETHFWNLYGNAIVTAALLYSASGDHEAGIQICEGHRKGGPR